MTYSYVIMGVSESAYNEVKAKLKDAGYEHAIHEEDGKTVLDMHGIALGLEERTKQNSEVFKPIQ